MDFRELINKIDSINSEAKKEPERLTFDDAVKHVKDITFTPPSASGAKFSIANNPKFKGQDINDPKVKLSLLQDALKNFPAMLFGEIAQRIKPTTDAQIELSQFVGDISNQMDPEGSHIGMLSKQQRDFAIEVVKAALRSMELERDPDQSTYNDDDAEDANEMESSLPWKKYESTEKQDDKTDQSPMVSMSIPNVTFDMAQKLERIAKEKNIEYSRQGRTVALKGKRIDMTMLRTKMGLAQTNIPMVPVKEEVVDEAHYQDFKQKFISVNKDVKLAGDSIWDEGKNPQSVHVKEIQVQYEIDTESDDAEDRDTTYVSVQVEHDGPWTIYTDTGFERAISQMIGIDVDFTEQGMQDDGEASLEGSVATKDIPADAKPLESIKQQKTVEDDSGKDRNSVKPEMVKGVAEKIKAEYVDELRTYMDRKKDVVQQLKSSGITDPKEIEREIDDMDDDILSYYYPGDIKGKIEVMNSVLELGPDADGHDIVDLVHNNGMDTSPREEIADQFQNELKKADPETFKKLYGNTQTISDVEQEDWFQGQHDVTLNGDKFYETFGWIGENDENIEEAEYQGRTVKLNKPMRGDVKKFKVYVKNPKGNVVKVNFGDPDMRIKKSNPARRKSFRARHNCDSPGPKHKARYWSCRKW